MKKQVRCIRRLFTIVLAVIMTMSLVCCKKPSKINTIGISGIGAAYSNGRPALGPSVEKETEKKVDITSQTRLTVKIISGSVKITRGSQEELQIIEKTRLRGPATKEHLNQLLKDISSTVETTSLSVSINHKAYFESDEQISTMPDTKEDEGLKPLYRYTVEMELVVPETITSVDVNAENALITLSDLKEMSSVNLFAKSGLIYVDKCSTGKISVSVDNGDIWMEDITGYGTYECGRGDIMLTGLKGYVELKSLDGVSVIEKAEGKLNCDISAGSLTVKESKMESGSVLYASTGTISADLVGIGGTGTYTMKSSAGDIQVKLPKKDGWSMIAKSTRGRIKNNIDPVPETLETGPGGEVYGDVNGGGSSIDIYTDRGDIILN